MGTYLRGTIDPSSGESLPVQDWPSYEDIAAEEDATFESVDTVEKVLDRDLDDWLAAQARMNQSFPEEW